MALLGGLTVALVAIAFLLGRESARPDEVLAAMGAPPAEATARTSVAATPSRSTLPPALASAPRGTGTVSPTDPARRPNERNARSLFSPAPPITTPEPEVDTRTREAIASYFDTVDAMGGGGVDLGSPNDFAMMIVGESATGNFSVFDQMLRDQRANLRRLQGMNPPGELRAYHRKTIELTEKGIRLMEQVRRGLESGDMTRLMSLPVTAQEMQSDAEAAERLATDLKRKFGLAP